MNTPVEVSATLQATVQEVWQALTHAAVMRNWYFDIDDFVPEPGFTFSFTGESEGVCYMHRCRVVEVIPFERLSYSWRYDGFEGDSLVTFFLKGQPPVTEVTVLHKGIESFGPGNPHLSKENFAAGWKFLLQTALKNYIEKPKPAAV